MKCSTFLLSQMQFGHNNGIDDKIHAKKPRNQETVLQLRSEGLFYIKETKGIK